jgi:leucyl aminopeptidase
MLTIKASVKPSINDHLILTIDGKKFKKSEHLNKDENASVQADIKRQRKLIHFNSGTTQKFIIPIYNKSNWELSEELRKIAAQICGILNENYLKSVFIISDNKIETFAIVEGLTLSNYQFLKYKKDAKKKLNAFQAIGIDKRAMDSKEIQHISAVIESTYIARDLVNEPHSYLNSVQISEEFKRIGKSAGFSVEVWNESRIAAQKMGGLLAVNKGSKIPPTFNILEYKPKNPVNDKPYVLVGKGVVYDTGGLSLKPTPMSMDFMKSDMAGSAVVAGVMNGVASLNLPIHVIGLVPATDNWVGENSYAPGDVITMYDGTTVEIMNTDAEGRLILADALHFAKKLKPELVCDFATLTGAAVRAIGTYATAIMTNTDSEHKQSVFESSYSVFERLVEFPLWAEYAEELKSPIADMTNLGKSEGGQISAAKFLEHFVDYPWMHFDIAGPAFNHSNDTYKPKGGTGVCVRLMLDFLYKKSLKK